MADAQSLLDACNAAIEARLAGNFEEYQEGDHRFRGLSLDSLMNMRDRLQKEVAAASSGGIAFGSIVPVE